MNLHHLEYIVEIANEKNISKAAEKLHISQPTLSIYLSKLEKELNLKLFHRANNVLTITEAGQKYVDTCKKILELKESLYRELYSDKANVFRMGILSSDAAVFAKVMQDFIRLYPQITLQPTVLKSREIYRMVLDGELDFGFITSYSANPREALPDVSISIIKEYELMLCIAKSNPVYGMLNLENGILQEQDYPLLDGMGLSLPSLPMIRRRILEDLIPAMGLHPRQITVNDSLELWDTFLRINNVYGFSPYSYVTDNIAQIPLKLHPKIYKLLIYPKGIKATSPERQMIKMVIKELENRPYYYRILNTPTDK